MSFFIDLHHVYESRTILLSLTKYRKTPLFLIFFFLLINNVFNCINFFFFFLKENNDAKRNTESEIFVHSS